ncbi:MerR family transcriptional regulator [Streptomyces sp. SID5785]|uniref:MerR family transcriptional regulator n=1 Tax=Streptomyces sp. SID5785 TaxID=2690309 RepID=UPI0013613F1D|nr:MerR family transcriptional regulator [Streptomyces sp. SID5785]MZD04423.1 MerR family transcriptional regulator [Streptomyces sp. SID5785]
MELLTIGAFARASRLSPKALRLYDDLGLLTPARVDPVTGYRLYAPHQLDRARLVAWLRRLGMPLARIQQVCALESGAAAREVRAYWAGVEADTAARRELVSFLVDHLAGKDPDMTSSSAPLGIRYAARTDTGRVRAGNQDAAYAGARLLAVADGYGERGAPASAAAIDALRFLETDVEPDTDGFPAGHLLNTLEDAVDRAAAAVREAAGPDGAGDAGTTLTAMLWTGSRLALVHIGDSRVYLLRDGELFRITHDHTLVQSMVDEGRLTPEEAASHPQRALLVRSLGRDAAARPDLRLHDARPGDRFLLCSDGLSAVVPSDAVHRALAAGGTPDRTADELIALANASGGPDNVSCVVADVVEAAVPVAG